MLFTELCRIREYAELKWEETALSNSTQSERFLEFKSLCRAFEDGFVAVNDFNLTIRQGEFVTFLGPSGCGKTRHCGCLPDLICPAAARS